MAKHTIREILAQFASHVGHTHEAACEATYNLGFAAGEETVKVKLLASDKALLEELEERHRRERTAARAAAAESKAPPAGATSDEEKDAKVSEDAKVTSAKDAADAAA